MAVTRLLRIELTVADLARSERFYVEALGFAVAHHNDPDAATLAAFGGGQVRQAVLRRGAQTLALQAFDAVGAPYPADATACDQVFQHFAMPVADMGAAVARLAPFGPAAISKGKPQHLPARSGGATAWKFRDPDGHPLELIQFPDRHAGGIDHSAIAVLDAERSIAFYRGLGLNVAARQTNVGPEQDALDGLSGARVDVVALEPPDPAPHVELLAYHTPVGRPCARLRPHDITATRLVFATDVPKAVLTHDPDGHALLLSPPEAK